MAEVVPMSNVSERQATANTTMLNKYGAQFNLTEERFQQENLTPEEEQQLDQDLRDYEAHVAEKTRNVDLDNISEDDAEVALARLCADMAQFDEKETHVSKVVTDSGMDKAQENAKNGTVEVGGMAASAESLDSQSAQQVIADRGLDYESNGETPYLENGEPKNHVKYVKIPATQKLKNKMSVTLDPRMLEAMEKVAAKDPVKAKELEDLKKRGIHLAYKNNPNRTKDQNDADRKKYEEKYPEYLTIDRNGGRTMDPKDDPYKGNGFSSSKEQGYMGGQPEMTFKDGQSLAKFEINKKNYQEYCGDGDIEFKGKVSDRDPEQSDPNKPMGAENHDLGKFNKDGLKRDLDAERDHDNAIRKNTKHYDEESKREIEKNRNPQNRTVPPRTAKDRVKERNNQAVQKHLARNGKSNEVLANNQSLSPKTRKTQKAVVKKKKAAKHAMPNRKPGTRVYNHLKNKPKALKRP